MALKDRIISKAGRAYDKVRPRVMPGARFFLLKRAGQTERFAVVVEITGKHYAKWNAYREQMQFKLADDDSGLPDKIAQTSFIGYGVPVETEEEGVYEIDVFAIKSDARDRIPPVGSSPFWKLYGMREMSERFTIPEDEEE